MNYATVDPGNTSIIATRDLNNRLLTDGASVTIPDFAGGERTFLINNGAMPEWNLYDLTNAANQCTPSNYYTRTLSYLFTGTAGVSGTVAETATCNEIPIDDLLTVKRGELASFTDAVFFSAFQMEGDGGVLFWVNNSLRSQLYRFGANSYYQWTPPDPGDLQLVDGTGANVVSDSGSPWRDVPVWLVRVSNNNSIRTKADQVQWTEVQKKGGKFGFDTAYASDDVESSLELAHSVGDWAALAAIDVEADPNTTNPWPVHSFDAFNGAPL